MHCRVALSLTVSAPAAIISVHFELGRHPHQPALPGKVASRSGRCGRFRQTTGPRRTHEQHGQAGSAYGAVAVFDVLAFPDPAPATLPADRVWASLRATLSVGAGDETGLVCTGFAADRLGRRRRWAWHLVLHRP